MGQAKSRGSQMSRVAEALGRSSDRPKVFCNNCQQPVAQVEPIDVTHLKGIQQAFCGRCVGCETDTWAVRGETASVKAFYETLEKASGQPVRLGKTAVRTLS